VRLGAEGGVLDIQQAQQAVVDASLRLVEAGLIIGTWGNVSIRIDKDSMVVTPTGMGYDNLTADDIPVVEIESGKYTGPKPSAEAKLHAAVYRGRSKAGAVIHTHAPNASTVAAAQRELPPVIEDMAQVVGPSVRVAEHAITGTKKMIRGAIKAMKGRNAVLLANHGALCCGSDIDEALTCCLALEKACKAFIEGEFLGGATSISKFEAHLLHQYYLRKYSKIDRRK
jgi:L-fuculose-phosphate aldolase